MTDVNIPGSVKTIQKGAFFDCSSLESIAFPDGLTSIGSRTFENCTQLSELILNEGIKTISAKAFLNCTSLETVLIPKSVTSLATNSFTDTILLVYENSYAHTFAEGNGLPYFILTKADNPEIAYGTGISGTVTYSDGTAAAGAVVEIFHDDSSLKEKVTADENGAYSFTYAEVGKYTIRATDAEKRTASDTVSVKRMNVFSVFLTGETDLVLKNSWNISGTVSTDKTATITLADTNGNTIAQTESTDGTFTFDNIPNGSYILVAENENGSASTEITVFNGNISGIELTIESTEKYATITGTVEVEDREYNRHARGWVDITIYNSDGNPVGNAKTDGDGAFTFTKLPFDEYSIVAETSEIRPDKKKHYDRSHTLTGYAYVSVTEAKTYELETIVLSEENDDVATISGKITAKGESQACEVTLSNVFRHEQARLQTGKNGKYSFKNVRDGLYFITAVTQSDGMGFAVVVVRNGKVYGETDITVDKRQAFRDREDSWKNDVPECASREDAVKYRDRIAEEKRYFDGLSEKEKKQFSKEYRECLNKYSEWIADYEYSSNDDTVKLENGGMIMSGEELSSEEKIELVLNVEKRDPHVIGDGGIETGDDYIQQSIENTAGNHQIVQYYDITLSKKQGEKEHSITSVSRDTDTTGKVRITMEIPEEYRGHKHYSFVHVHNGETRRLVDLDDNPDTVTFEIDRFSTFTLTYTDEDLVADMSFDERLPFIGAQIKTDGIQGLRYIFSVTREFYDTLNKPESYSDNGAGFGTVIFPAKHMNEGDALVKGYANTVNGKTYTAKTVPAVNLYSISDSCVEFTVVLTEIPEKTYAEEYVAVSYATYIDENGEEITVYGEQTNNVSVFRIAEIAYSKTDSSDEFKEYLLENILNKVDPEKYPISE